MALVESVVDWYEGRHHRSVDRLLPLLEDREVGSDATLRAQVLLQLEQGLDSIGDPRAVQIGLDGLALCSELGDDYRFATLASNTGYSEYNRGHWREALRRFGVQLALDSFGTGVSSLTALRTCEADVLKLDGSVARLLGASGDDDPIVRSIIQLAHALDMQVVAEWVSSADQLRRLRVLGCDLVQGHLLGEPTAAELFASRVRL